MSNFEDDFNGIAGALTGLSLIFTLLATMVFFCIAISKRAIESGPIAIILLVIGLSVVFILWAMHITKKDEELVKKQNRLIAERREFDAEIVKKQDEVEERERIVKQLLSSSTPFNSVAQMTADIELLLYDEEEEYLCYKDHPAYSAAETVKKLKSRTKEYVTQLKSLQYKIEFLKIIYPELSMYLDDDAETDLLELGEANIDIEEISSSYDRTHDYIDADEWKNLSTIERNQLALDRWIKNVPKAWIGRIYEMYIGQEIKKHRSYKPYNKVDMYGIRRGINDLGRDIIYYTEGATYIIQCKCWAMSKEIHENTMCQTLGTAVEFKIEREMKYSDWMLIPDTENVVPVIVTPTPLSDVAQRFAKHLKIKVITTHTPIERIKYMVPLIKCNINNGNKIYHLPFDQQWHRTIIDESRGEFYAMTVKEAEEKGFRRAFRHFR